MDIGSIHLSVEIFSLIFSNLKPNFHQNETSHLRNARLVCKFFNHVASPLLFSKVWISPDERDWERLTKIAKHPIFSKYVREVEYDSAYYETCFLPRRDYIEALGSANNPKTGGLTCACDGPSVTYTKAAVLRGYKEYNRRYQHQTQIEAHSSEHMTTELPGNNLPPGLAQMIEDSDDDGLEAPLPGDLICLVRAFQSMTRVNHLVLTGGVKRGSRHYRHHSRRLQLREPECFSFTIENEGVRGQDRVIIDPGPWAEYPLTHTLIDHGFSVLAEAASMAGISALTSFTATACGYGVRSGPSHRIFLMSPSQLTHARNTFCNLTTIDLQIATHNYESADYSIFVPSIESGNIAQCLCTARGLRTLRLAFSTPYKKIFSLETVLGNGHWSRLHDLSLKNFYVREEQFISFLLRHKASLRKLHLDYVVLHHGDFGSEEESEEGSELGPVTGSVGFDEPVNWENAYRQMSELMLEQLTISSPLQDLNSVAIDMHWHSKDPAKIHRLLLSGGNVEWARLDSSEEC